MRKLLLSLSVAFVLTFLFACSNRSSETSGENKNVGETIDLTYATYVSKNHFMGELDQQMIDRIKEQTNNRVNINPFFDGTLVEPTDWYQELLNGSANIVQGNVGSEKDRFKLQYATAMFNYGITDTDNLLQFTRELEEQFPELSEEYKEIVPISRLSTGATWIHTNKKPIRSIDDFKGLNLKVADDASIQLAKALGANPIQMPISETYSALEKGTIDGVITGADPLKTFNFAEVTKYSTKLPYATPWIYSKFVNKKTFDSLPEDIQELIKENGNWWEDQLVPLIDEESNAGIELAKKHGNEIIELSDEETEKILKLLEEIAQETAKDLDGQGYNGTELLNKSRELAEKYLD